MKRILVAATVVLTTTGMLLAQVPPAVPGGLPAAPGAAGLANPAGAAAAPGNQVNVSNKCCSIWDFLGVNQVGKLLSGALRTRLGQAITRFLSPLGRVLGLGPSILSDKFANEGGAMGLANQLKKEEAKVPLKVQAIKYLATLDCICYPEVVDALLASLDDCAEVVRYEALKALRKQCKGPENCPKHCAAGDGCPDVCESCQCQKKVVDRLNELLLARDPTGCLKEKSQRVRDLATQMIEECLTCRQPPPAEPRQEEQADPVPQAIPEAAPPTAKATGINRYVPTWFKWKEPETKPMQAVPVKVKPNATEPVIVKSTVKETIPVVKPVAKEAAPVAKLATPSVQANTLGTVTPHTTYYRAQPAQTVVTKPTTVAKPVMVMPETKPVVKSVTPAASKPVKPAVSGPLSKTSVKGEKVDAVAKVAPPQHYFSLKPTTSKPAADKSVKSSTVTKSVSKKPTTYQPVKETKTQRHLIGELFGY